MKKIIAIIGTRPQFIKHAAFEKAAQKVFKLVTIHTGQHYAPNMSQDFFDKLGMQKPDYLLKLGGGTHGTQTGKMMLEIEAIVLKEQADLMLVYGDTNSTLAGALVASKLHLKVAHIEAGLRSYNKEMPEEINRVLTDHVSDFLFVPSEIAQKQLAAEGINKYVLQVGDIMKDFVMQCQEQHGFNARAFDAPYFYATIHRPYNTDEKGRLAYILKTFNGLPEKVVFSIHPRTIQAMKHFGMTCADFLNIHFIAPQAYVENLSYLFYADALITDSGGMQKEAYWMQKKCVTIRKETEWVETLSDGANVLRFNHLEDLGIQLRDNSMVYKKDLYGNGDTAALIVEHLTHLID